MFTNMFNSNSNNELNIFLPSHGNSNIIDNNSENNNTSELYINNNEFMNTSNSKKQKIVKPDRLPKPSSVNGSAIDFD